MIKQSNNIHIRDEILISISIVFLILFSVTPGLTQTIYFANGKGAYVSFLFAICCFGKCCNPYFSIYSARITDLLTFLILAILLFCNNYNLARGIYDQFIYLYTFFIIYVFGFYSDIWHNYFIKIYIIFSSFFMTMTFFELTNPSFFIKTIMPLFSEYSPVYKQVADLHLGYVAGFSANAAINVTILTFGFASIFSLWLNNSNYKFVRFVVMLLFFLAIFITGKRGPVLFALISLVYTYFATKSENGTEKALKFIGIIIFFILVFVVIGQFVPEVYNTIHRISDAEGGDDLTTGRSYIWKNCWSFFETNPLLGCGWDSMKYLLGVNAHNVYIQLLCEVGIIGSAVFLLFFGISFFHVNIAIKRIRSAKQRIPSILIFSLFVQIFFLLYCFTGNPLYDAFSALVYFIVCSAGEYYYYNNQFLLPVRRTK